MPRPVQQPTPPFWVGATSENGLRRAGRRGANLLGLTRPEWQAVYEGARKEAGFSLDTAKVLQLHWVHAGASDDDAWSEAGEAFRHLLSVYAEWVAASVEAGTEAVQVLEVPSVDAIRRGGEETLFDPVIGSSKTVADLLTASMNNVTTTHLAFGVLPGMDPKGTAMSMRRLIREVAPQLVAAPAGAR